MLPFFIAVGGWITQVFKSSLPNMKKWIYVGCIVGMAAASVIWIILSQPPRPLSTTEIPAYITSQQPSDSNVLVRSNGWMENLPTSDGSCQFLDDGGYKVTLKNTTNTFFKCASEQPILTNFALEVDMRFLSGVEGGILFHWNASPQGEHFYYFYIRSDRSWGIRTDTPGDHITTDLDRGKSEAIKTDKNTLLIVASKGAIYLFINGVPLHNLLYDPTYLRGRICLAAGSQDRSSQSEVVFSDMKIWSQPSLVS